MYDKNQRQGKKDFGEEKQFEENVINIDRVARVVKGGRRFRFRALVVVGDKKSRIGVGVAKGSDVQSAVTKAVNSAKNNMVTISLNKNTIPHETTKKIAGANVLLKPAGEGTGIIAGGTVRSVLAVTGIKNILSKSLGSSNKINVAYATIGALMDLESADKWVTTQNKAAKKPAKAVAGDK